MDVVPEGGGDREGGWDLGSLSLDHQLQPLELMHLQWVRIPPHSQLILGGRGEGGWGGGEGRMGRREGGWGGGEGRMGRVREERGEGGRWERGGEEGRGGVKEGGWGREEEGRMRDAGTYM